MNKNPRPQLTQLTRALVACSLLSLAPGLARTQTLPGGMSVASGTAQVSTAGAAMTVTNSANAILNWQTFSIGQGASVRFEQPSAASSVLNRVVGTDPSAIFGSLTSNGRVWLLNPNGVLFGANARVDVAGLVASTLRLNDSDWLAGRFNLGTEGGPSGSIVNQGELRSSLGGRIALVGHSVTNEGLVEAPGGQVLLAAGSSVELIDTGAPNLGVKVTAAAGEALNLGTLRASGGRIDIHAAAVNQMGIVRADSVNGNGGEVVLQASNRTTLGESSQTSANSSTGTGGSVRISGEEVGLNGAARVEAQGETGGGEVLVGGGWQGRDARVPNARAVYVGRDAGLSADATGNGSGGTVVLWGNEATRAFGSFTARGGAAGGDGGRIETSGGTLDARPLLIDVAAAAGRSGNWLLDPFNFVISDSALGSGFTGSFTAIANNASVQSSTVAQALNSGTNVSITTGGAGNGAQAGNVDFSNANIAVTAVNPGSLTVIADGTLNFTDTIISSANGPMPVTLTSAGDMTMNSSSINARNGTINVRAPTFHLTGGSTLTSTAAGDAIVVAGPNNTGINGFSWAGVATPFVTSAGRWITYVGFEPTDFLVGTSNYNFRRLGAAFGDWASDVGNGIVFSSAKVLPVTVSVASKTYDATTTATLTGVTGSGVFGETVTLKGGVVANFVNKTAANNKPVIIATPEPFNVLDAQGKPVFGYGLPAVLGNITKANLLVGGITPVDRSYNTQINVALSGTPTVAGFGSDNVSFSGTLTATVATKDAGTNKAVSLSGGSLQGTDAANYNLVRPTNLTVNITPAVVNVTGLSTANKVYNANTSATVTGTPVANAIGFDFFDVIGTPVGTFDSKNVGTGKTVTVTGLSLFNEFDPQINNNYVLAPVTLTANITPATLLVNGLVASNKVYDGTTAAVVGGTPSVSALGSDTVFVQGAASGTFANKNVGTGKTVTVTGINLGGTDAGNYTAQAPGTLTANITAAPLTLTGVTPVDRTYNTQINVGLTGTPTVNGFGTDVVSFTGSLTATVANKNAGTNKAVSLAGGSLAGDDAGNYTLVRPTNLTVNITPATVVVTGLTAVSKVYDATTSATVTGTPNASAIGFDFFDVIGTPVGTFGGKDVGTGKPVAVTGLSLFNANDPLISTNYTLAPISLSANITPATLIVNGLVASNKVYDGTTAATLGGTPTVTPLGNDVVGVTGTATGTFVDRHVGTGKSITVTGVGLTGADAGNYIAQAPGSFSANITPAPLAITGVTASNRVYDGTIAATLSGTPTIAPFANDVVSFAGSLSATFADKTAAAGKPLTVTGGSLEGAQAGNYTLVRPTLTATITPATLTLRDVTAANKVYDGTTVASLSGSPSVLGFGFDVVNVVGTAVGAFGDKNVGTGKTVTITGLSLGGADSANYTLAPPAVTANITPRNLTISGLTATNKVYDGTTSATLGGSAVFTALGSDIVTLGSGLTGSFADKNVGNGKAVTLAGLALGGADGGNYTPVLASALTANITPRPLTFTGLTANSKVYDGSQVATFSGTAVLNKIGSDDVSLSAAPTGVFATKDVGNGKTVTLAGLSVIGVDASNYAFTAPTGFTANITPATLTYTANATQRTVGDAIGTLSGTVTGFVATETQANATTGTATFTTAATPTSAAGSYAINGSGLTATNYTFVQATSNATALTIVPPAAPPVPPEPVVTQSVNVAVQAIVLPTAAPPSSNSGMADLSASGPAAAAETTATATSGTASRGPVARKEDFGTVRLASLSPDAVRELLDSRDRYKKATFAESISRLELNPALADMRACTSLREAQEGVCLVTDALQKQFAEQKAREAARVAAATPAPAPAPAPSPAAAPAPAPQAAPTPAPAVAAAAAAAARAPQAAAATAAERRKVQRAALPQIERKVALVIGVDTYADSAIPPLANSVKDARAMARVFEDELGYETIVLENASRAGVVAALNRLALDTSVLDSVVVYYAGHGELVEATKLGYWQLADADSKKPETWLSNSDIGRLISRIPASQVALISDSCYSGSLVAEERIRAATSTLDPIAVLTRKTVVVMSSGGNEPVFDAGKNGHSPFAWNLMSTLKQVNSWRPGGQIFERVRFAVARELPQRPQYGASSAAGHQAGGDYLFEQRLLEKR